MSNDLVAYEDAWAAEAVKEASENRLTSGGRFISHRSGLFTIGDDLEFPEICAIVLASAHENVWYNKPYDPNATGFTPPKCFALSELEAGMGAHPVTYDDEYFEPQSNLCIKCPRNEKPKKGEVRRKECRNMRRLLLLVVGQYAKRKGSRDLDLEMFLGDNADENAAQIKEGDVFLMKIPPVSLFPYKETVNKIKREYMRPMDGMIMRIYTESLRAGGHTVLFEPIGTLPLDLYPHVKARRAAETDTLMRPYTPPRDDEVPF